MSHFNDIVDENLGNFQTQLRLQTVAGQNSQTQSTQAKSPKIPKAKIPQVPKYPTLK